MGHHNNDHRDIGMELPFKSSTNQCDEIMSNMGTQSTMQLTDLNESDGELLKPCGGPVGAWIQRIRDLLSQTLILDSQSGTRIKYISLIVALSTYSLYVFFRWMYSDCETVGWREGYGLFFILCTLSTIYVIKRTIITRLMQSIAKSSSDHMLHRLKTVVRWAYFCILGVGVVAFLAVSLQDAAAEPRRYLSLGGYFLLLLIAFVFSKHPNYVRWDTIARGVSLHMLMAFIIVKWEPGRSVLSAFSEKVIGFLEFSYVGARFVYGDMLIDLGIFIFKSLSVLFFLAMVINVMFYYGVLQSFFKSLGELMQALLGTTIIESSNSVASVFLGMSESPLLFKPYVVELTASEIHAFMTSGFATVAGTVLAAYVAFGADAATLVSASAMAAPASLTLAKLFYPETHRSKTSANNIVLHESEDANAVDAACKGAILGCALVPAIAANVLSLISLVAFFNSALAWFGQLAGIPDLSFEKVVGIVFVPFAWAMGVDPSQIADVGRLIGIKTVINEFVGYKELGLLTRANKLSARSKAIATYAMCGFANPGSVAIFVSGLITVCPDKSQVITGVALRAFVAGSFSSFLSASLAGFITPENGFDTNSLAQNNDNYSMSYNTSCYYYSW